MQKTDIIDISQKAGQDAKRRRSAMGNVVPH
jgi:hypothetical protein